MSSSHKKYSFTDPLLRLWVRLHCRPVPPPPEDVAREVQNYALGAPADGGAAGGTAVARPRRVRQRRAAPAVGNGGSPELAYAGVEAGAADERKGWGIIEID